MPEYSRPNLSIPSTLWGEVKVAAFRRGVRPVQVVIECLRERFTEPVKDAVVERKVTKEKPEPQRTETTIPSPEEKPKPDQKTCKHSFAMKPSGGSKCVKCGWEP